MASWSGSLSGRAIGAASDVGIADAIAAIYAFDQLIAEKWALRPLFSKLNEWSL